MAHDIRVKAENITKRFPRRRKGDTALAATLRMLRGEGSEGGVTAVDNVSLTAYAGETVGIIGRNGSGKSTLLRVLAGIYAPDRGSGEVQGRCVYLSGFGHGMNPKLSMRDNIYLVGKLRGMSHAAIRRRFDEIVAFSDLHDYIDTPVRTFSSGMVVRLNFSLGIMTLNAQNPDVLLLDEIAANAGGDIDFQNKTRGTIRNMVRHGTTTIMASHSLSFVAEECDRVIWLSQGTCTATGSPEHTIKRYRSTAAS